MEEVATNKKKREKTKNEIRDRTRMKRERRGRKNQ